MDTGETGFYSLRKLREIAGRLDRTDAAPPCHSENVAKLALAMCKALEIRGRKKDIIITACLIHDVGKIAVDPSLWSKRQRLTYADRRLIEICPKIAAMLARWAGCDIKVAQMLYYQHIWYNGNGYPEVKRKKGDQIPIGARILAICEAYDAMTSGRPYREPIPPHEAAEELRRHAIKQFDPRLVEIFVRDVVGLHQDIPPCR